MKKTLDSRIQFACFRFHVGLLFYQIFAFQTRTPKNNANFDAISTHQHKVRVGNSLSSVFSVENGTPRGSIISPLLFLVMINDLPDNITSSESLCLQMTVVFLILVVNWILFFVECKTV